jgi:hypothetical protein
MRLSIRKPSPFGIGKEMRAEKIEEVNWKGKRCINVYPVSKGSWFI